MRALAAAALWSAWLWAAPARAGDLDELGSGDCHAHGLALYPPPGSVIPTNAKLILEGVGLEQERAKALAGQTLVLRSQDEVVQVSVTRLFKSSAHRVAMLLKPRGLLKANRSYQLMLGQVMPNYRFLDGTRDTPKYLTGKGPDESPPGWISSPAMGEGLYRKWDEKRFARFLRFNLRLQEESPAYVVLEMRRARGSIAVQTYFVPVVDDTVLVGQDPCSGSFVFEDGRAYRGTFQVFDIAGNAGEKLKPMEFNAPREVGPP